MIRPSTRKLRNAGLHVDARVKPAHDEEGNAWRREVFTQREAGTTTPFSSWPDLIRPSTRELRNAGLRVDARVNPAHDEEGNAWRREVFTQREAGTDTPFSSWPDLIRPSTRKLRRASLHVDARVKPALNEEGNAWRREVFTQREAGTTTPFSSWPDLIRPSTRELRHSGQRVDARVKPAHDEEGNAWRREALPWPAGS
ncbi:hypothetical protein JL100_028605 [Skermanella mucosa]|uniref:hypothetical protein n=1 Tax=Skermanella mucosa TaxID=1789672 RepID=UPI00192B9223|nr:hypothetical protein [Skermanella mucosa]UEM20977.1 hypothetical protein JL100_028605 [Skermanella mucosa]